MVPGRAPRAPAERAAYLMAVSSVFPLRWEPSPKSDTDLQILPHRWRQCLWRSQHWWSQRWRNHHCSSYSLLQRAYPIWEWADERKGSSSCHRWTCPWLDSRARIPENHHSVHHPGLLGKADQLNKLHLIKINGLRSRTLRLKVEDPLYLPASTMNIASVRRKLFPEPWECTPHRNSKSVNYSGGIHYLRLCPLWGWGSGFPSRSRPRHRAHYPWTPDDHLATVSHGDVQTGNIIELGTFELQDSERITEIHGSIT